MTTQPESATLPSVPADRAKLKGMIEEAAVCMQRIDDQREAMKDIFELIKEDFAIAPKYSRKMAKAYHKHTYRDMQAEQEEFELLYEGIIGTE
jgi:hypothetical protein